MNIPENITYLTGEEQELLVCVYPDSGCAPEKITDVTVHPDYFADKFISVKTREF